MDAPMLSSPTTKAPRRCRASIVGIAAAGAVCGLPLAASSAVATGSAPMLSVRPAHVHAGESVTLRGRSFPPQVRVALTVRRPDGHTVRAGRAQAGRNGTFVAILRIRDRTGPGLYVVSACERPCRQRATARFRIVRA
jgi:hypothetical protein